MNYCSKAGCSWVYSGKNITIWSPPPQTCITVQHGYRADIAPELSEYHSQGRGNYLPGRVHLREGYAELKHEERGVGAWNSKEYMKICGGKCRETWIQRLTWKDFEPLCQQGYCVPGKVSAWPYLGQNSW